MSKPGKAIVRGEVHPWNLSGQKEALVNQLWIVKTQKEGSEKLSYCKYLFQIEFGINWWIPLIIKQRPIRIKNKESPQCK